MSFDAERPVYDYLDRINSLVAHRLDGATRVRYVADVRRRVDEARAVQARSGQPASEALSRRVLDAFGTPEELVAREVGASRPGREPAPVASAPTAPDELPAAALPPRPSQERPPLPRTRPSAPSPAGPAHPRTVTAVFARPPSGSDPHATVGPASGRAAVAAPRRSGPVDLGRSARAAAASVSERAGGGTTELVAVLALTVGALIAAVPAVVVGLVAVTRSRRLAAWVKAAAWAVVLVGALAGGALRLDDVVSSGAGRTTSFDLTPLLSGAGAGLRRAAPLAAALLLWRPAAARRPTPG